MVMEYVNARDFDLIPDTCGHYNSYPKYTIINVQPRMVEHYEVDFFTKGKGMLVIDGKPIEFEEGSVNFRKPGQVN